jgi:hypothetical protein
MYSSKCTLRRSWFTSKILCKTFLPFRKIPVKFLPSPVCCADDHSRPQFDMSETTLMPIADRAVVALTVWCLESAFCTPKDSEDDELEARCFGFVVLPQQG